MADQPLVSQYLETISGTALDKPNEARHQGTALVAKACGDEPGMQAIRSDTRALQAAS